MRAPGSIWLLTLIFTVAGNAIVDADRVEAKCEGLPLLAIVDTPVDYSDPQISASLDFERLKAIRMPKANGDGTESLYDRNTNYGEHWRKKIWSQAKKEATGQRKYTEMIKRYNKALCPNDDSFVTYPTKNLIGLTEIANTFNDFILGPDQEFNFIYYTHGTHIASILTRKNAGKFCLVNLAETAPEKPDRENLIKILERRDFTSVEAEVVKANQPLRVFLEQTKPDVLNFSMAGSPSEWFEYYGALVGPEIKEKLASELWDYSAAISKFNTDEYRKLLQDFPMTLFVQGAGNGAQEIGRNKFRQSFPKAQNLLVVGATKGPLDASIANYSNYSESFVDVYTSGKMKTGIPQGQAVWMHGTSQATPNVAVEALALAINNPKLRGESLKKAIMARAILTAGKAPDGVAVVYRWLPQ